MVTEQPVAATAGPAQSALKGLLHRITRALRDIRPEAADTVRQFLRAMIDRDDPDKVLEMILRTGGPHAKERA